jgi:hypothetical protein
MTQRSTITINRQPESLVTVNRGEYLKIFFVFFILFAVLTKQNIVGWNDASRMAQIQAIVEQGTFIIDQSTAFETGDKYFYNQHFYSDKPPILALYAAPVYFGLRLIGLSFDQNSQLTCYLVTLLSIGLLSILGLILFRKILREFLLVSSAWADVTTLVAGAGTLILPYSIVFNNHVPSGVLILMGVYCLLQFSRTNNFIQIAYSGICFSLAGSIDINCFLFIPIMLVLLVQKSAKAALMFGLACLPAIVLYLFLNLQTSGSLMPPALNAPLWNYPGSAFGQENLSGLAKHHNIGEVLFYAFHMLIGNRGLISHTPILLVAIGGILIGAQRKFQYKAEYGYILLASGLYIALYILRTTNYSGWAFGIRWFASLMLILGLPIAYLAPQIRSSKPARLIFMAVASLSIAISLIGTHTPFTPLDGNELQERFAPTNTIVTSLNLIVGDLTSLPSLKPLIRMARLALGAAIAYFCLYQFAQKLNSIPPTSPSDRQ